MDSQNRDAEVEPGAKLRPFRWWKLTVCFGSNWAIVLFLAFLLEPSLGPGNTLESLKAIGSRGEAFGFRIFLWSAVLPAGVLLFVLLVQRLRHSSRATLFVSYPNEQLDTASELARSMRARRLTVRMIPFVERPEAHNEVIAEVLSKLREADIVLVVAPTPSESLSEPRLDSPRFYEAEIFAASYAGKPVILVGRKERFRVPKTAYDGYPVLDITELEHRRYEPLAALVHYAVGTKWTVNRAMEDTLIRTIVSLFPVGRFVANWWWAIIPLSLLLVMVVFVGIGGAAGFLEGMGAFRSLLSAVLYGGCAITMCTVLLRQFRIQLKVRQTFKEEFAQRRMTNKALASLMPDISRGDEIVACLFEPSPSYMS